MNWLSFRRSILLMFLLLAATVQVMYAASCRLSPGQGWGACPNGGPEVGNLLEMADTLREMGGVGIVSGPISRSAGLSRGPQMEQADIPLRKIRVRQPLDRRCHYGYEHWERLAPTHVKIQYAGSIGIVSVGWGWDYGRRGEWETDLMFGAVPTYRSNGPKVTCTLRECYVPWSIALSGRWALEPLSCGIYCSTIISEKFWVKEPERYPKGYYTFPTRLRSYFFVGQRISCRVNDRRRDKILHGISFYYELSTCDFYMVSAVQNRSLSLGDILSLSFGIKLQLYGPRAKQLYP